MTGKINITVEPESSIFLKNLIQEDLCDKIRKALQYLPPFGYQVSTKHVSEISNTINIMIGDNILMINKYTSYIDCFIIIHKKLHSEFEMLLTHSCNGIPILNINHHQIITNTCKLITYIISSLQLIQPMKTLQEYALSFREKNRANFTVVLKDIVAFTSKGNNCHLIYFDNEKIKKTHLGGQGVSLNKFQKQTKGLHPFFKINKNCIVNANFIKSKIPLKEHYQIILKDNIKNTGHIPSSFLRTKSSQTLNHWLRKNQF